MTPPRKIPWAPRSFCTSSRTLTPKYDNFLDEYGIVAIVKKYSDYVRYPIQMEREKEPSRARTGSQARGLQARVGTYTELETLNSMIPIWKKQKPEVTDEEVQQLLQG